MKSSKMNKPFVPVIFDFKNTMYIVTDNNISQWTISQYAINNLAQSLITIQFKYTALSTHTV